MKSSLAILGRCILAGSILVSQSFAQEGSIRFFGSGYLSPGAGRVKISLENSSPANVSMNFTIECWLKCDASLNNGNVSYADHGDGWITGNVFLDRDIYGNADPGDYGFSIGAAPGLPSQKRVVAFGINRKGEGITIRGNTHIADGKWHHVALTRNGQSGEIRLFIDGKTDASGKGPAGDISYPSGRITSFPGSDPFLVIGAEKHDGGGAYPSYNGLLDELRISSEVRYKDNFIPQRSPFHPDTLTAALYHFDEEGEVAQNTAAKNDSESDGMLVTGGDPVGPVWLNESPFQTESRKKLMSSPVSIKQSGNTRPVRISQEGNSLVVRNASTIETLVIWNSEGKRLAEIKKIAAGTTRLPLGQNRGLAFIHITLDNGNRFTEKLLLR